MIRQHFLEHVSGVLVILIHREDLVRLLGRDEAAFDSEASSCYSLAGFVDVPFCPHSVLLLPVPEELLSVDLFRDVAFIACRGLRGEIVGSVEGRREVDVDCTGTGGHFWVRNGFSGLYSNWSAGHVTLLFGCSFEEPEGFLPVGSLGALRSLLDRQLADLADALDSGGFRLPQLVGEFGLDFDLDLARLLEPWYIAPRAVAAFSS